MYDLIPISRVYLEYKPASVAINQITYSGIILGESKDLHIVPGSAEDDGHFVPADADTNLDLKYDVTKSTSITVPLTSYPNLRDYSEVDVDTVSLYDRSTQFLAMYRSLNTSVIPATNRHTLIPLSYSTCVLTSKDVTDTSSQTVVTPDPNTFATGSEGVLYTSGSVLTIAIPMPDAFAVPGSFVVVITPKAGGTVDHYLLSDRDLTTAPGTNTGTISNNTLQLFTATAAGVVAPVVPTSPPTTAELMSSSVPYVGPGYMKASITLLATDIMDATSTVEIAYTGLSTSDILGASSVEVHSVLMGLYGGDLFTTTDNTFDAPAVTGTVAPATYVPSYVASTEAGDTEYIAALHTYITNESTATIGEVDTGGTLVTTRIDRVKKSVEANGVITLTDKPFSSTSTFATGLTARTQFSFVYDEESDDVRDLVTTVNPTTTEASLDGTQNAYTDKKIIRGYASGQYHELCNTAWCGADDGLLITGDVYLGYIAENRDPTIFNNAILVDSDILSKIGYADPRNPLGFACQRSMDMIGTTRMYVMPIDTSTDQGINDGLGILSNYIDIFQVYLLVDDYRGVFDTWLEQEADPDNSRFRIGMNPTKIVTDDVIFNNEGMAGTLDTTIGDHYMFTTSVTGVDLAAKLIPGSIVNLTPLTGAALPPLTVSSDIGLNYVVFVETNSVFTARPVTHITAVKHMNSVETADYMYNSQNSDNMWLFKILSGTIEYKYTPVGSDTEKQISLDNMFSGILMFAPSISTPPHQPLTSVVISGFGYGRVNGTTSVFSREGFTKLVSAGYYVLTSTLGAIPEPYCIRDASCGLKQGTSLNGTLPKIKPVALYAKDIYFITKQFLGKNNVVEDVIQEIRLRLEALRRRNLSRYYKHLGTVLAKATAAEITIIPNGLVIRYGVSPQDQLITIDNYVTVTDAVVATEA